MSTNSYIEEQSSEMDFDPATMKVADLKRELKLRGLAVTGKKEELIERLQLAIMPADDTSMNVGPGDEDDDLLAQANALLEDDPVASTEKLQNKDGDLAKKKVAIKRDSIQAPSESSNSNLGKPEANQKQTPASDQKTVNPHTVSSGTNDSKQNANDNQANKTLSSEKALSDIEKAKSRAERFGVVAPSSVDEKKAARAARFGISNTTSNISKKIGESPSVDLETLKRRAERFGQSSSTTMQKLELQQKIKDRESRFGKVENSVAEPKRARITAPNENLLIDEKMKKRAERFGIKA